VDLNIILFSDLNDKTNTSAIAQLKSALLHKGIVGIQGVPDFENKSRAFVNAARKFSALQDAVKQKYAPNRDAGETEGYELGAEWFKNNAGEWQVDDKKTSYYAAIPDSVRNKWPNDVELKTPYLELGELIFNTGKWLLNAIGMNEMLGLQHDGLVGCGRMLHYLKESDATNENPIWCGAHLDHGVFTALIPAYYFCEGTEIAEPEEAGLYIVPTGGEQFEKIHASQKDVLLFQVGEFGQLISNDEIKATKHMVRKAKGNIERFSFAVFYSPEEMLVNSQSILTEDARHKQHQLPDGRISYSSWANASLDRYRVR